MQGLTRGNHAFQSEMQGATRGLNILIIFKINLMSIVGENKFICFHLKQLCSYTFQDGAQGQDFG